MTKIAVVILNWNGLEHLKKFLPSVVKHSTEAEIIVADNNSSDGSYAYLNTVFLGRVNVIRLKKNEGFSKGYNLALKAVSAEYYVLLNSDVEVTSGWLHPVISFLDAHPEVAACQPKIKSYHNKEYFEYAGAGGGFIDKLGFPFCRGRIFDTLEKDEGQYDDITEVLWASGACLFIRSTVYWKSGGLDDDFFAHMEEIDLCWRIRNEGYKICYFGKSTIYHVGGGTLNKSNPRKTYLNFRNGLFLLYKNLPSDKLFTTLLIRMIMDGAAALKFLIFDSPGHFFAVLKAHFSFYKSLKNLQIKRRKLRNSVTLINPNEIFPDSIVLEYFFRKVKFYGQLNWKKNTGSGYILHQKSVNSDH